MAVDLASDSSEVKPSSILRAQAGPWSMSAVIFQRDVG